MWHSFKKSLEIYKSIVNHVDYVFDVGVQYKTSQLLEVFPNSFHYLFEPAAVYHQDIEKNYTNIDHQIVKSAVSSKCGVLYQHLISQDFSGNVTHSHLRNESEKVESYAEMYIDIVQTNVTTLDSFFADRVFKNSFNILKIDVDGEETNVMLGGRNFIDNIGLMIVECPTNKLSERVSLAHDFGFEIWDIVSPGYYYQQLSQVDIFFISKKIKDSNIEFNPWLKSSGAVVWDEWVHVD